MLKNRTLIFTILILFLVAIVGAGNVFAISVYGRVGTPITGGSGGGGGEGGGGEGEAPPETSADTTPPVISNISVTNITESGAEVRWTTNEASSSFVDYGTTSAYGSLGQAVGLVTDHTVNLSGLASGTTYHFRVRSADSAGNEAFSLNQTFITSGAIDTAPPIISNISASDITDVSARIDWTTNEPADSQIDYGETISYELGSATSSTLITSHSFALGGLRSDTLYHFRVRSADASGNAATSGDNTFRTADVTPPLFINGPTISDITATGALVSWTTNELTTGIVFYTPSQGQTLQQPSLNLKTAHSVELAGLAQATAYSLFVRASDSSGNIQDSLVLNFQTEPDTRPPANVSNFSAIGGDTVITVSWQNPSDSDFAGVMLVRRTDTFPASQQDGTIIFTGNATSFIDTGLTNGLTYYYTIFARDTSNNFSSGATDSATPYKEGEAPPEELPPGMVVPPEEVVPPTVPGAGGIVALALFDFNFSTAGRAVAISPQNGRIRLGPRAALGIDTHISNLRTDPKRMVSRIDDANYLFALRDERFTTDIETPENVGAFEASIIIEYVDETYDIVRFMLDVEPHGFVYEIKNGRQERVAGANVTLYKNNNDSWELWNAQGFNQINPQVTDEDGVYKFFVSPGTYYLEAKKDGYNINNTSRFEITDAFVNKNLELIFIPVIPEIKLENLSEIIKAAPRVTQYVAKIATQEVVQFVQNPITQETNKRAVAPTLTTVAAINTVTAVSFFNIWNYVQYVLTQPLLLLRRRKRFGWGVAYNALTRMPVDLAIVRLFRAAPVAVVLATSPPPPSETQMEQAQSQVSWQLIQTRVTGKDGRFIFFVGAGKYRIEVVKQGFIFPTTFLKEAREDEPYTNLYHGEAIEVSEGAALTPSIPLDLVGEALPTKKIIARQVWRGAQHGLALGGIIFTGISFVISPSVLIGIFLSTHILLYLLFRRLAISPRPKGWGIVYDEKTKKPLKTVVARIFETQYNKLLGTQVTDTSGRYGFLVGKNAYYVTYERQGYTEKKSEIIDITSTREPQVVAPNAELSKAAPLPISPNEAGKSTPEPKQEPPTSSQSTG